ncbi:MAG TPA: hypothetical protein VIE88_11000 [Vicinamibacteria bacterium]|jgi:hypothetical protein
MNPHRNEQVEVDREARPETTEASQRVLLEIGEDARRLKNRYSKETIVPEGGE